MAKIDLLGAARNPLNSKLSAEISKPSPQTVEPSKAHRSETPARDPVEREALPLGRIMQPPKLAVCKQVKLSSQELAASDESLRVLGQVFGISVQYSEVTRALWSLLHQAQDDILDLERIAPKLTRPASRDLAGKADIEDQMAVFLLRALKQTNA